MLPFSATHDNESQQMFTNIFRIVMLQWQWRKTARISETVFVTVSFLADLGAVPRKSHQIVLETPLESPLQLTAAPCVIKILRQ